MAHMLTGGLAQWPLSKVNGQVRETQTYAVGDPKPRLGKQLPKQLLA